MRRLARILVLLAFSGSFSLAAQACGGNEAPAPSPPPERAAPAAAAPAPVAPAPAPPAAEPAAPLAPASVEPCTITPAPPSPFADLVRASDGTIWTVDRDHHVRRYALSATGCTLTLDTGAGADGVVPTFAGAERTEAGHLLADASGHVFVSTETTSERWSGTHRDYACDARVWAVAPGGDRGYVGAESTLTLGDTGCVQAPATAPAGYSLVVPLAVLPTGDLVATAFSDTQHSDVSGNSVALLVAASGAARGVLYDGPNAPDHPALSAFACGARVCMLANAWLLVLDPTDMSWQTPVGIGALAGASDGDAAGAILAPLGGGDALYSFRTWDEAASADVLHVVRVHGLPG